jgi:hypothetical protein
MILPVRPTDDDELLAVQLCARAPVSRRIGASIVFETTPSNPSLPVLQDELAVANLMAVELRAELATDERLTKAA